MWFCVGKVRIEALKGKIFNFNENNENHRVYPSACVMTELIGENVNIAILYCIDSASWNKLEKIKYNKMALPTPEVKPEIKYTKVRNQYWLLIVN